MSVRAQALGLAVMLLGLSGCAQIMGVLRPDLNDDPYADAPPTTGGRWSEGGFLSDDLPEGGSVGDRYVGHAERDPASGDLSRSSGPRSWVSSDNADANRRESFRGRDDDQPNADTDPVMDPAIRRQYKNGSRATRADFVDESQNEGSLWASDGQTNYYFTKNRVRGVGDIITINMESDLIRDIGLESRRTLTGKEREYELAQAQERLRAKAMGIAAEGENKDQLASSSSAPNRGPASNGQQDQAQQQPAGPIEIPQATLADVDVSKSLTLKPGDPMMGEIIERYPNGNYKVRATKRIPYKGGTPRFVTLIGVVKGTDISEEDTVPSGKLYEYRVEASR